MIGRWTVWIAFMMGFVLGDLKLGMWGAPLAMAGVWLVIEGWIHFSKRGAP